jgi:23S rRNA (uracil1939-C5)-methyltransferase
LYAHIEYERQRQVKSEVIADAFARIAKMPLAAPVAVRASREEGYRMRARLHARYGKFGFFREGTHELCDAAPTRQLLPDSIDALRRLAGALQGVAVTSCELSENAPATERALLVELAPSVAAPDHIDPIEGISGLLFVDHEQGHITVSYGSPYVVDHIPASDARCADPSRAVVLSGQSSSAAGARHASGGSGSGRYGVGAVRGRGLFAVSLAGARRHAGCGGGGGPLERSRSRIQRGALWRRVRVQHLSVESHLKQRGLQRPDTLLLDPPRTGVSTEAMSGIVGLKVPRVVYLSCDPATLARDVKRFSEPATASSTSKHSICFRTRRHIETLAVKTRT